MRATLQSALLAVAIMLLASGTAAAQAISHASGLEQSIGALMAAFPGGEPIAATFLCIAGGTLLLRLTKWLALALTFATFGFLAVALLITVEPDILAKIAEAVDRS